MPHTARVVVYSVEAYALEVTAQFLPDRKETVSVDEITHIGSASGVVPVHSRVDGGQVHAALAVLGLNLVAPSSSPEQDPSASPSHADAGT